MSKVYFPIRYIDVPAGPPHHTNSNPAYRVSVGIEHWDGGTQPERVYKVQMAYNGVVHGRKSPSFPEGADDMDRVYAAMREIKAGRGRKARGMMEAVGEERGTPIAEAHAFLRSTAE
jgi:hypothetical protein